MIEYLHPIRLFCNEKGIYDRVLLPEHYSSILHIMKGVLLSEDMID